MREQLELVLWLGFFWNALWSYQSTLRHYSLLKFRLACPYPNLWQVHYFLTPASLASIRIAESLFSLINSCFSLKFSLVRFICIFTISLYSCFFVNRMRTLVSNSVLSPSQKQTFPYLLLLQILTPYPFSMQILFESLI